MVLRGDSDAKWLQERKAFQFGMKVGTNEKMVKLVQYMGVRWKSLASYAE